MKDVKNNQEVIDVQACELKVLKVDRTLLEEARGFVRDLAEQVARYEQDIIARIDAGAEVDGVATVITRRRQNISWLTAFKDHLGAEAVVDVKDAWPVTFYKALQLG